MDGAPLLPPSTNSATPSPNSCQACLMTRIRLSFQLHTSLLKHLHQQLRGKGTLKSYFRKISERKISFTIKTNLGFITVGLLSYPLTSAYISSYLVSLIAHSFILFPSKQHWTSLIYTLASSCERTLDRHSPAIKPSCSPRWVSISSTADRE